MKYRVAVNVLSFCLYYFTDNLSFIEDLIGGNHIDVRYAFLFFRAAPA